MQSFMKSCMGKHLCNARGLRKWKPFRHRSIEFLMAHEFQNIQQSLTSLPEVIQYGIGRRVMREVRNGDCPEPEQPVPAIRDKAACRGQRLQKKNCLRAIDGL